MAGIGGITGITTEASRGTKSYKRSPWSSIRGFTQFKRNMQQLALIGDGNVLRQEFVAIAERVKNDMNATLRIKTQAPTEQYVKSKRGKAMWLRNRGIVAKPFKSKGVNKSFAAINFRYGPHAHLLEFGTGMRYHRRTGKYVGFIRRGKFAFFRPTINKWKSSGRFVKEVGEAVKMALKAASRMPV